MKKYSMAYFGTPDFSARFLEMLVKDKLLKQLIDVKLVVTQSDKPVGRKQILTPSSVKRTAQSLHIPFFEHLDDTCKNTVTQCDYAIVFAYGFKKLIPLDILKSTKKTFSNTNSGFINIHPSILPKYRGAAPIAYPILLGDVKTGVTLFVMDEKMDHGPIICQEEITIDPNEKRPDLEKKLTELALQMFKKLINPLALNAHEGLINNKLIKQDDNKMTHARFMVKEDGFVPFLVLKKVLINEPLTFEEIPILIKNYLNKNPQFIENFKLKIENSSKIIFDYFRGLYPWPGIWTKITINHQEKRLKITDVEYTVNNFIIKKLQLEGKNEVDFKTFQKAYSVFNPL